MNTTALRKIRNSHMARRLTVCGASAAIAARQRIVNIYPIVECFIRVLIRFPIRLWCGWLARRMLPSPACISFQHSRFQFYGIIALRIYLDVVLSASAAHSVLLLVLNIFFFISPQSDTTAELSAC